MTTTNLTKTNMISAERAKMIESIIGIEITDVITQIKSSGLVVTPYDNNDSITKKLFRFSINGAVAYRIKSVEFDSNTGILKFLFRKRWQRGFSRVYGQGQPVGYKLPTTKVDEGFIWGNFCFTL